MKKMYQVFVSSTYEDLKEERNEVLKTLLEQDCIPSGMEYLPAADASQWAYIKKLIGACDYYVVIIAGRYGSQLPDGMSFTEKEYRYALEQNIPIIAFVHENINKLPADKVDKDLEKLESFLGLVEKKLYHKWNNKSNLARAVSTSLFKLKEEKPSIGWIKGNTRTDEHLKLLNKYSEVDKKYKELKDKSLTSPKVYRNFEHVRPPLEEILIDELSNNNFQDETLKIRVLGVCFHKSFPCIKDFVEEYCHTGRRIEIRLSKLNREFLNENILDKVWENYYKVYQDQLDEFCRRIKKIENANVSLKITKYSFMPNWHGILINKKHLFLSACVWNSEKCMTAGENHYIYYKKEASWLHNKKILQFRRWFDFGRFHNAKNKNKKNKQNKQLIFDTRQ